MNFRKIKQILKNQKTGAILIEFAFSLPILMAILYFILDGPGLRLYQLKLKNSAYLAINLIQNITFQRENKLISNDDLKKITFTVFGNIYRSNTMLKSPENDTYPLEHYGHIYLWCVYGNSNGTASVKWVWDSGTPGTTPAGFNSTIFTNSSENLNNTIVKFGKNVAPASIYKDLAIKSGETKIILEVSLVVSPNVSESSSEEDDEQENSNENNKEEEEIGVNAAEVIASSKEVQASGAGKLGFYIIPIKPMNGTLNSYLNHVVIFKPKPGLFDPEEGPKIL